MVFHPPITVFYVSCSNCPNNRVEKHSTALSVNRKNAGVLGSGETNLQM